MILPGYTHMQRAQPVLAAHVFLAYVEKFERDRSRLADCRQRLNVLPLGAAALAGTTLPIDRHAVAPNLASTAVAANSLDVSSDRDFVLESVFVLTLIAEHLSGWAEEWILWSTQEFGFPDLAGRDLHRQQHHAPEEEPGCPGADPRPDRPRHRRLTTLLVLVKGLPLAYNRDLQEDKEPLFDALTRSRPAWSWRPWSSRVRRSARDAIASTTRRRISRRDDSDGIPDPTKGSPAHRP